MPDKRDSNTNTVVPPAPPKRGLTHKRTNTEWSTDDDSEITEPRNEPNDLRDSGISTASLLDFQSHLTNLNNLGYEDFEPRSRCNDIMNISPPSVISTLNVSTGSFASGTFQGSHSLPNQEARKYSRKCMYTLKYIFICIYKKHTHKIFLGEQIVKIEIFCSTKI